MTRARVGAALLAVLALGACSEDDDARPDGTAVTTTTPPVQATAKVTLEYRGPDPYGAPENIELDVTGVVDIANQAARVNLPVVGPAGVTEIYLDDVLYIQLPGTTNLQQYEPIDFDGLTREVLKPTGVQLAGLADAASTVVALAVAASAPGTDERVTVDLTTGAHSVRSLGVATGKSELVITRAFDDAGRLTEVSAKLPLPAGTADVKLTLQPLDAPATIAAPPENQILHPGPVTSGP